MIKSERKKHNNSIRRLQIIRTRGQNKVAVWMSRKNITLPTKFMTTDHPNRRSKQRWLSGWEEKITLGVLLAMGYYSLKTNCKYQVDRGFKSCWPSWSWVQFFLTKLIVGSNLSDQVDRGFKSCRPCWSWVPIFLNKIIVSLILFDSDAYSWHGARRFALAGHNPTIYARMFSSFFMAMIFLV